MGARIGIVDKHQRAASRTTKAGCPRSLSSDVTSVFVDSTRPSGSTNYRAGQQITRPFAYIHTRKYIHDTQTRQNFTHERQNGTLGNDSPRMPAEAAESPSARALNSTYLHNSTKATRKHRKALKSTLLHYCTTSTLFRAPLAASVRPGAFACRTGGPTLRYCTLA